MFRPAEAPRTPLAMLRELPSLTLVAGLEQQVFSSKDPHRRAATPVTGVAAIAHTLRLPEWHADRLRRRQVIVA